MKASASGMVGRSYPPGPPTGFAADSVSSSGGMFSWDAPTYTGGLPLGNYKIYVRTPQGSGSYTHHANASSTEWELDDLSPDTPYDMYVAAVNANGESAASNVIQITTEA